MNRISSLYHISFKPNQNQIFNRGTLKKCDSIFTTCVVGQGVGIWEPYLDGMGKNIFNVTLLIFSYSLRLNLVHW